MITDEDLADAALHTMEPEQRFRFIEQLARKRLLNERTDDGAPVYDEFEYMSAVLPAAQTWGISELASWHMPSRNSDDWHWQCRNFRAEAMQVTMRIMFEQASKPGRDPHTVALDGKTKQLLRFHLQQVRSIIDEDAMPDSKKEELYEAIANLEREIDKSRTRVASVVELAGMVFSGKIKASEAIGRVVTIIQEAMTAEKSLAKLPAPAEPKRLQGPKGPREVTSELVVKRTKPKRDLDDEIPF